MKFSAICLLGAIGLAAADKLPVRFGRQEAPEDIGLSGPYEPSGWQPDGPQLTLPNQEYGPPAQEYGPPPTEGTDVEVSEENIVFAGQSVSLVDVPKSVSNQYLPPAAPEAVDRNQVCLLDDLAIKYLSFISCIL